MGRAINNENDIDKLKMEMEVVRGELKELQDVVVDLSQSLISTKQVHHVDMDEEFTPPAGKRKKTTKRKTVTVD